MEIEDDEVLVTFDMKVLFPKVPIGFISELFMANLETMLAISAHQKSSEKTK